MKTQRLLLKVCLLLLPFMFMAALYAYLDPFKVIKNYPSYYDNGNYNVVEINRDFVSYETFMKHYKQEKYNAFIFGNSRSRAFESNNWKKYLDANSKVFHFDANLETVYGILKKLQLLDQLNVKIDNAIFIIDHSTLTGLEASDSKGIVFMKHYKYTDQTWFNFHKQFFEAFYNYNFFPVYIKNYVINKNVKAFENSTTFNAQIQYYDQATNDLTYQHYEKCIQNDSINFFKKNASYFRNRREEKLPELINPKCILLLRKIKTILAQNNTKYKIVINPMADLKKMNELDVKKIRTIFGSDVYDFSGFNEITCCQKNYYETSHFRVAIANQLLDSIYTTR